MIKLLKLEMYKLRRRKTWLMPLLFLAIIGFWTFAGTMMYQDDDSIVSWEYLMYQYGTINTLLFTIVIAIIASRLCDIELKGETLRLLAPITSAKTIYACKFLYGSILLLLTVIGEFAALLMTGIYYGVTQPLPTGHMFGMFAGTFLVAVCTLSLQQALSFLMRNQMVAMIVGICGSFLGFFALLFPPAIQCFSFWSYYADFTAIKMDWDVETRMMDFGMQAFPWARLAVILLLLGIFYFIGRKKFVRKEW